MRKGQISILVIGLLMAVSLGVMGFFSQQQVNEIELQRLHIDNVAMSIKFDSIPNVNFQASVTTITKGL